jgi:RNA polymerase sigma-70 factor (ECF subfamily)
VLRIAANESLNYLRRNKRLTFSEELPELADEGDHPDVDGVPMEQLLQMIGSLPVGYRTVFNLYVFEGMSHKEIATELNIRENSSASQFLRAKRMLANMIKEWNKSKRR